MLYSIPGRCGIEISNDTALRLREKYKNFCVMKEAGGKVEKVRDLCARADGKIDVMSGDDGLTLDFMSAGAKGVVSVASNIIPEAMSNFVKLIEEGRLDEARAVNEKLSGFFKALFIEPNPVPAKTALHLCGRIPSDFVRLPLCRMQPQNLDVLKKEMEKLELI